MKKIVSYIKKCPYLFLLLLSGLCVYLYSGIMEPDKVMAVHNSPGGEGDIRPVIEDIQGSGQGITQENADEYIQDVQGDVQEIKAKGYIREGVQGIARGEADESHGAVNPQEKPAGVTEFIYYDAENVSSLYYSDPGKVAMTTEYPYETVEDDYFADAAFIGDSRTLGFFDYSGLENADFYCDNGFCTYLWSKGEKVTYRNEGRKVVLDEIMDTKRYGKIYLMLGLNDCGYGNVEDFKDRYGEMLDMLHTKQPDAVIYLLSNLHLSKEKSDSDQVYNNVDINAHNVAVAELADGETFFYLNVNSLFIDENWNLKAELTFDGTHLYADGYVKCFDYLKQCAVVR